MVLKGSTEDQNQSLIRRLDLPITLRVVRGGFVMGDLISSAQFFNLFIPKRFPGPAQSQTIGH